MYRLPSWMHWTTITGRILIGVVLVALVGGSWAIVSVTRDRPVEYDDITEHFKYGSIGSEPGGSLLRPVGGALPPLLGVQGAAVDLPRYACPAATRRWASSSSPGRTCPSASRRRKRLRRRAGRIELRRLPYRHRARRSPGAPPRIVLGMPCAPARSAGARRIRARMLARRAG